MRARERERERERDKRDEIREDASDSLLFEAIAPTRLCLLHGAVGPATL